MKNAILHVCARLFSRAFKLRIVGAHCLRPSEGSLPALPGPGHAWHRPHALSVLCAIAFVLLSVHPAFAVRVWNLGDGYEQPPGTPTGKPQRISTGVAPDPGFLTGQRHIKIRVVGAGNGEPVENASAYLVRLPDEEETVVYSTDSDGRTIIWDIEDCYRKLVVSDGVVSVKQWLSLPPGCEKDIVVKLPYNSLITATRPEIKSRKVHFYAFRKQDDCYERTYKGWVCCKLLKIWLPSGTYQLMMDACDKDENLIKRYVWDDLEVAYGKQLFVKTKPHEKMLKSCAAARSGLRAMRIGRAVHGKPYLRR